MSNYIEFRDKVAFHPGYYIKEIIDESGLTQEDFAKRLDTTPKNLSILVRGEQSLSIDIAMKLSRMLGTGVEFWLNLQQSYDALIAQFRSEEMLEQEKRVFAYLDYAYFKMNFNLPDLPGKTAEQIKCVREFLKVATIQVFLKPDMVVNFRNAGTSLLERNIVRANAMLQIAVNQALSTKTSAYNRRMFEEAAEYALTLTEKHDDFDDFYPLIRDAFAQAGVVLKIIPDLSGSKIDGATRKIGKSILLMVSDRRLYSDTFWFTLFYEISHIITGDYGVTFGDERKEGIDHAEQYAEDKLIPSELYQEFIREDRFGVDDIRSFAKKISRTPGIVLGRLQHDKIIPYKGSPLTEAFRQKYEITAG